MQFIIVKHGENLLNLTRRIGYVPSKHNTSFEFSFYRPLSRQGYPRFHLYIKEDAQSGNFIFNLHLDQKKPSYEGTTAHSGEYEGKIVEQEAARIKSLLEIRE